MRMKKLFISLILGLGLTLALLWLLGGGLTVVRAADFTVDVTNDENDGSCAAGDCSLREAIIAANGNGQADTITLGSGTYALTLTGTGENNAATGDLDITDAMTITGAGPSQTIIDASSVISDRVFDIRSGAGTVVISGVTVINGNVTGWGGGIYNYDADLTLINTVLVSNTATFNGGGVYVQSGDATLSAGQILGNEADIGGGVYVDNPSATFTQTGDSMIAYNTARDTAYGGGGVSVWSGRATLSGGQILSNTAYYGGGVHIMYGSATLDGGQILSNTAGNGGGVYVSNTTAAFTQTGVSTIAYNTATGGASSDGGGGVYVYDGSATLSGGQILSNTASSRGGGLYVYDGSATLSGGQILDNNASQGGGVYVNTSSATLNASGGQIASNTASSEGGGVFVDQGSATLSRTPVVSNTADDGGGLYNSEGALTLVNTTVSHNVAMAGDGGGLYSEIGTTVLTYTTVASNTATSGADGIHVDFSPVLLQNTVVAYNGTTNCSGEVTSNGYNLDSGNTCGFSATGDITNTDPLLGPLADNGGDTLTHALLGGSPAIDKGTCVGGMTTDQRGMTRPQGDDCDMGAYEYAQEGGAVYLPIIMRNHQ